MKRFYLVMASMVLGLGVAFQPANGDGLLRKHHHTRPNCEPGFKIVEEVVMQDVTRTVCKMVPETKKKWVYSWIDDPFCIRDAKHGECLNCKGPHCRKQLVKMQIDLPCPGMKCVTETIVERVPVTIYHKVPCTEPAKVPAKPMPPARK